MKQRNKLPRYRSSVRPRRSSPILNILLFMCRSSFPTALARSSAGSLGVSKNVSSWITISSRLHVDLYPPWKLQSSDGNLYSTTLHPCLAQSCLVRDWDNGNI